jgi:hypothetical protein
MVTYAAILQRNIINQAIGETDSTTSHSPKSVVDKKSSLIVHCENELYKCEDLRTSTYNFVDVGRRKTLDWRKTTGGKKLGQDGHANEDQLLEQSGMKLVRRNGKKNWLVGDYCLVTKENEVRQLVLNLKLIIEQRCMRHCVYGHKDLDCHYAIKRHRCPIEWFVAAMQNIVDSLYYDL